VQTLPGRPYYFQFLGLWVASDPKGHARLKHGEHTDQPLADALPAGDLTSQILFGLPGGLRRRRIQVEELSPRLLRHPLRVLLEDPAHRLNVPAEVLQQRPLRVEKALKGALGIESTQVTAEDHAVEHRDLAKNLVVM